MVSNIIRAAALLAILPMTVFAGQAKHLFGQLPKPGDVSGRVTVVERVNRTMATDPVRGLKVYLFSYTDSKPFRALQQKCRRAMANRSGDPDRIYQLCDQALTDAYNLVPNLPAIASAQTGRDGAFEFDHVPPGRDYLLVGVKSEEVGSPIVVVKPIRALRSGQRIELRLSENDPWTGPLMMR